VPSFLLVPDSKINRVDLLIFTLGVEEAFAAAENLMRDYEFGQSEEDLGRISGFPIRTLGSRITETLP